jgi:urocanate hydratase
MLLNLARKHLGSANMRGKVYVSSGLGGMSGAQPKAAVICGCIAIIAEINRTYFYATINTYDFILIMHVITH